MVRLIPAFFALAIGALASVATAAVPASTTTLTLSPGPTVAVGTSVTLTARVVSGGGGVPAGTVQFCKASAPHCEDAALLGQAQLTGKGVAEIHLRLAPGTYSIAALFLGAPHATRPVAPSISPVETLTVSGLDRTNTTAQLTGVAGEFTLTSTVTAFGIPVPTGSVTLRDQTNGGALLASVPLSTGQTSLQYAGPSLPPYTTYDSVIAVADFNADGIPDEAVTNTTGNGITVLLGNGDGTFTSTWSYATEYGPSAIASADVNRDGIPDLLVGLPSGGIETFLGNGDGTFVLQYGTTPATYPRSIALGDFNGDGLLDAVIAVTLPDNSGGLQFLEGTSNGSFISHAVDPSLGFPFGVASADLNGDGIPDLVITTLSLSGSTQNAVVVQLGNGDGTFRTISTYPAGVDSGVPAIADFNGDGKPDLAVGSPVDRTTTVLLGRGDGTFNPLTPLAAGAPVVAADLNGDGIPDLVAGNDNLEVLIGKGDGTFQALTNIPGAADAFVVADLNGDGLLDILTPAGALLGSQVTTVTANHVSLTGSGSHSLVATYSGDAHYAPSSSAAVATGNITAAPTFHPAPAIYPDVVNVTLTDATPGASIFYTLDGSTPTAASTLYSGPIRAINQTTLKAIAASAGASPSSVVTAVYVIRLPAPVIAPPSGLYAAPLTISIQGDPVRCASEVCSIFYTLDGSTPTAASTPYTGPLVFTAPGAVTITAIVIAPDHLPSAPSSATYSIGVPSTIALSVSPSGTIPVGTTLTLTAQVQSNGLPVPHGEVVFCNATVVACSASTTPYNHPDILGRAQVVNGVATFPIRVPVGATSVRAIFQGTPRTAPPIARMISAAVTVTVTVSGKEPSLTTAIIPRVENQVYSFRNTVQAFGRFPVTGTVAFSDSLNGAAPISLGVASLNPAISTLGFTPAASANVSLQPDAIASGDLNRDGIPDVVTASFQYGGISVLLGNGDGTFTPETGGVPGVIGVTRFVLGDATGDGVLDIVYAREEFNDQQGLVASLVVLPGLGDGTFGNPIILPGAPDTSGLAIADVNGDGIPDLVTASDYNTLANDIRTYLGRGDGTFATPIAMRVNGNQRDLVVADLNGDNLADLTLTNEANGSFSLITFLGNGDGTYTAKSRLPLTNSLFEPTLGDLNGDGVPDLVSDGQSLSVLLGNGDGTFRPGMSLGSQQEFYSSVQLADFDDDGKLDIATRHQFFRQSESTTDSLLLLRGNGDGTFITARAPVYNSPLGPFALGDFDGNGVPDVAYADSGRSFVRALLTEESTLAAVVNVVLPGSGTHTIAATYSGSAAYQPSTSAPLSIDNPVP